VGQYVQCTGRGAWSTPRLVGECSVAVRRIVALWIGLGVPGISVNGYPVCDDDALR